MPADVDSEPAVAFVIVSGNCGVRSRIGVFNPPDINASFFTPVKVGGQVAAVIILLIAAIHVENAFLADCFDDTRKLSDELFYKDILRSVAHQVFVSADVNFLPAMCRIIISSCLGACRCINVLDSSDVDSLFFAPVEIIGQVFLV